MAEAAVELGSWAMVVCKATEMSARSGGRTMQRRASAANKHCELKSQRQVASCENPRLGQTPNPQISRSLKKGVNIVLRTFCKFWGLGVCPKRGLSQVQQDETSAKERAPNMFDRFTKTVSHSMQVAPLRSEARFSLLFYTNLCLFLRTLTVTRAEK
eukprot:5353798-Amphidinium_carterae.1